MYRTYLVPLDQGLSPQGRFRGIHGCVSVSEVEVGAQTGYEGGTTRGRWNE